VIVEAGVSIGWPLTSTDPDVNARLRIAAIFRPSATFIMPTEFAAPTTLVAASMAREDTACCHEQGRNAYRRKDEFHIFDCFFDPPPRSPREVNRFCLANHVPFSVS